MLLKVAEISLQNYFKRRKWHSSTYKAKQAFQAERFDQHPTKKKSLGQHFLRNKAVVHNMLAQTRSACENSTILEIGCGDGFLTEQILAQTGCKRLVCLEVDPEWARVVTTKIKDPRLLVLNVNALDYDWNSFYDGTPMVLLANLPYNVSIPLLKKLRLNSPLFQQGVFMVQEEVAQKLTAQTGRSFGSLSLFMQHVFEMNLLQKIDPSSFSPPPKVTSRLVHFKPQATSVAIEQEEGFWKFIKACFASPRRMLKNNLAGYNFDAKIVEQQIGGLRAQQLNFEQLLSFWHNANQQRSV